MRTHRVAKGENLYSISRWYGVPMNSLVRINGIQDAGKLQAGTVLRIPPGGRITYTVRRGDTAISIAEWYGVPLERLARINSIDDPDDLPAGVTLRIPRDSRTARPPPPTARRPRASAPAAARTKQVANPDPLGTVDASLAQAEASFRKADFEKALSELDQARTALERSADASGASKRRTRLEVMTGTLEVALDRREQAVASFERALELEPELQLDPSRTSPKVWAAFELARARARERELVAQGTTSASRTFELARP